MSVNTVQNDGSLLRVAGGTLYADAPIGTILPYGGTSAPSGWMICDGTSLLRASYPELFAVIGTAFGSADSTHFNIPDMRESVPKGAGETGKTVGAHVKSGGLAVGEFIDDQYESHAHYIKDSAVGGLTGYGMDSGQAAGVTDRTTTGTGNRLWIASGNYKTGVGSIDSRDGATTEVKSVGVNYIIKAKMVAVPADFAPVDVVENGNTKAVTSNAVYDYINSLSGVTQVGDWKLIRLGSSNLYLGLYYHTNISPDTRAYYVPLPNGYSRIQHYFGQCFQEGYTGNVTGATHTGGNEYAMTIYFTGGATGNVYEVRACCLFQRNS